MLNICYIKEINEMSRFGWHTSFVHEVIYKEIVTERPYMKQLLYLSSTKLKRKVLQFPQRRNKTTVIDLQVSSPVSDWRAPVISKRCFGLHSMLCSESSGRPPTSWLVERSSA